MYQGALFRKSWLYATRVIHANRIRILSAMHVCIHPFLRITPYNLTLADLSAEDRREWGIDVYERLCDAGELDDDPQIYVLAGKTYYGLLTWLPEDTIYPLRGLGGIGKQLHWLNEQLKEV